MEEVDSSKGPATNIKEYIVGMRKNGFSEDYILDNLRKVNWPEDIISAAIAQANTIQPANPNKPEQTMNKIVEPQPSQPAQPSSQNLFTEPPKEVMAKTDETVKAGAKEKKHFSFSVLIALLFSPVPIVGLGIAMVSWDHVRRKNLSGGFIALFAMLINALILVVLIWIVFQLLTLSPEQLTGLAKYANDVFELI